MPLSFNEIKDALLSLQPTRLFLDFDNTYMKVRTFMLSFTESLLTALEEKQ